MKKSNKIRWNKICFLAVTISIIFMIVLAFIPFENLFITFSSPEKAFHYYQGSKTKVKLVVKGKDSDLVIGEDDDTHISHTYGMYNSTSVDVYQYKNTNDYFVAIFDTNGGDSQITDSFNSKFSSLVQPIDVLEKTYVTYYTNIQDFTDEYWVNVNGEKIIVNVQ